MPDTPVYRELYQSLRQIQEKHCYFLLATAAAAIALSVRVTAGANLSWSQSPLGLAVLCWSLSFYYGCRFMTDIDISTTHTLTDMRIQAGEIPGSDDPTFRALARQVYEGSINDLSNRAQKYNSRQFRFLIAGAILFIAWHVLEMGIRTPSLHDEQPAATLEAFP